MYILFKRHGRKRFFKRYGSFEDLKKEIARGHHEGFMGNNQFYYNTETRNVEILNSRLSFYNCMEYLESSNIVPVEAHV